MLKEPSRLQTLDLLRGLAALSVLAWHVRVYLLENFVDLQHAGISVGPLTRVFYLTTGFGHQAVIVFFALSGFLVGGKAMHDILGQSFSWPRYLLRRMTRLWIVIIPALILTLMLDQAGMFLTQGAGYDGRYFDAFPHGPLPEGLHYSLGTFLGNLAFLQSIAIKIFGTNYPMWSLAWEFWYYMIFPLALWVVVARVPYGAKAAGAAVLLGILVFLFSVSEQLATPVQGGIIWAAGAVAAWCSRLPALAGTLRKLSYRVAALVLLVAALLCTKLSSLDPGDLGLGLVVALTLPVLVHMGSPGRWYTVASRASSEISYTLYLTHYPLVTLIVMVAFPPPKLAPGLAGAVLYLGLFAVAIAWAGLVWWFFERHTDRVYAALSKALTGFGSPARRTS